MHDTEQQAREHRRPAAVLEGRSRRRRHRRSRGAMDRHSRLRACSRASASVSRSSIEELARRVIGQDEAVHAVANAVRRSRAGLAGSEPPDRLVHLPRADWRRQNGNRARARRIPVRRRARDGAHRHVRVHGEARRRASDRRAAGLRRLRGRRTAHRGGPSPSVLGRSCSTRSRRRIRTSSTSCCRSSTTAG